MLFDGAPVPRDGIDRAGSLAVPGIGLAFKEPDAERYAVR